MLNVLSRSSKLACLQVEEVMKSLPDVEYIHKPMKTSGDRDKTISLMESPSPDLFTDDLDRALLEGTGDIAIHSAKDLPFPLPSGLEVIALTKGLPGDDSLVSARGERLADLPENARVGTSSILRKKNIIKIRPDIQIVSIRGTIEERLALVESGSIDALIVATCALVRLGLQEKITEELSFMTHPLQGKLAVVARTNEPSLCAMFAPLDSRNDYGRVYIVGGGPGDPDLLTVKADKILKNADVICYDDLVSDVLIESYRAEKIYVGKRKGSHSVDQEKINETLYHLALKGFRVARLKGGDPFIFGRGGEEVDYLKSRFIPITVVPGITSVQAAAANTHIPLTHRGLSSELRLLSGHHKKNNSDSNTKTIAYYMGASNKSFVAKKLLNNGLKATDNAILVRNASKVDVSFSNVEIDSLANDTTESPLMIVAGPVVNSRRLPDKILYTGLDPHTCFVDGLIIHYPLIETAAIDDVQLPPEGFDAIVFTSKEAVRYCIKRCDMSKYIFYAIGPSTAAQMREVGCLMVKTPKVYDSSHLNELLIKDNPGKILYPCSSLSNNEIHGNPCVTPVVVYKTVQKVQPYLNLNEYKGVVFTSSSTVVSFFKMYRSFPSHMIAYVYGRPTFNTLVENGVPENVIIQLTVRG